MQNEATSALFVPTEAGKFTDTCSERESELVERELGVFFAAPIPSPQSGDIVNGSTRGVSDHLF